MRRAAKVDRNQPEIVSALRKVGADVVSLAAVGDGIPDLLVGYSRRDGADRGEGRHEAAERAAADLDDQIGWHAAWRGGRCVVASSVAEALAAIGVKA
jgi:hypothetical protein